MECGKSDKEIQRISISEAISTKMLKGIRQKTSAAYEASSLDEDLMENEVQT